MRKKNLLVIILEAFPEIWWDIGSHVFFILTIIGGIYGAALLVKAIVRWF